MIFKNAVKYLVCSVAVKNQFGKIHGTVGRYKIFRGQMPIDQTDIQLNDETILRSHTYYRDAALHFMAYDPTGIPAGKAKIFAMESMKQYQKFKILQRYF